MELPSFHTLSRHFLRYVDSLSATDARIKAHFDLKVWHTFRVVRNIGDIARSEGFSAEIANMARVIGLLHDIGRFRQFMEYGTFDDSISINHAEMAVRVLSREGIGDLFPTRELEIITRAILQHNIPVITDTDDPEVYLHARLIRDADKSDIWKIAAETDVMYTLDAEKQDGNYIIPPAIHDSFRKNQIVRVGTATCLNDYHLLRLAWIFDMNFASTFSLLLNKDHASTILAKLPSSETLTEITGIIRDYMVLRAGNHHDISVRTRKLAG